MPTVERALAALEILRPVAFDPCADAEPSCICGACGAPVYDGEMIYRDKKTGCLLGCEHCIDYQLV